MAKKKKNLNEETTQQQEQVVVVKETTNEKPQQVVAKEDKPLTKKYKLTEETIIFDRVKLYRIEAVKNFRTPNGALIKKGRRGGYIEKEENLCQYENGWVYSGSKVYGDSYIEGTVVEEKSIVKDSSIIDSTITKNSIIADSNIVACHIEKSKIHDSELFYGIFSEAYIAYKTRIVHADIKDSFLTRAFIEKSDIEHSVVKDSVISECLDIKNCLIGSMSIRNIRKLFVKEINNYNAIFIGNEFLYLKDENKWYLYDSAWTEEALLRNIKIRKKHFTSENLDTKLLIQAYRVGKAFSADTKTLWEQFIGLFNKDTFTRKPLDISNELRITKESFHYYAYDSVFNTNLNK